MPLDQKTFAIIVIITTVVSYFVIRNFFKIAPRFMVYAVFGILLGLVAGVILAWPLSKFFGQMGIVVAPYVMGIVVMVFVEFFIIEGRNIFRALADKFWY